MKELRIFGPPGTGKSTRLATEEIPNAVKKFGIDKVVVTSFTKAGAQEIATKQSILTGRSIPVDPHLLELCTLYITALRIRAKQMVQYPRQLNETYPDDSTLRINLESFDDAKLTMLQICNFSRLHARKSKLPAENTYSAVFCKPPQMCPGL